MKDNIKKLRVVKIAEMCILVLTEVIFLIIVLTNHVMRSSIFVDKSTFTLCIMMWLSLVISFVFVLYDFLKLKDLKIQNHLLENLAYLDEKTGIPNRTSVDLMFDKFKTPEDVRGIACVVTEIANIRAINETDGKDYGDDIIRDFSRIFENTSESYGFVGRNGGNEFITVIEDCSFNYMSEYLDALHKAINTYNEKKKGSKIILNSEFVLNDEGHYKNLSEMLSQTYKLLRK